MTGIVSFVLTGVKSSDVSVLTGQKIYIDGHNILNEWGRTCAVHNSTRHDGTLYTSSMCIARVVHRNYFDIQLLPSGNLNVVYGLGGVGTDQAQCATYCWVVKNCYTIPEQPNIQTCSTLPNCTPRCNERLSFTGYSYQVEYRFS